MSALYVALGCLLVITTLWDVFTTIVIPKNVERRFSFSLMYYDGSWNLWHRLAGRMGEGRGRMALLASFAPITLLVLFLSWALLMIFGFALVHFGLSSIATSEGFLTYLYFSGETFFTLGYGDMTPLHNSGRFVSVSEAGTGFGFLALVMGYIPVLYSHFSTREHQITLLDARAGSDPSAGELLKRHAEAKAMEEVIDLLKDWEKWSARQLEAFLSYPALAFYRSQHDQQSWLCALTAIMDTCALIEVGFEGEHPWQNRLRFQAQATFAMGRHLIVDFAFLMGTAPDFKSPDRLPPDTFSELERMLVKAHLPLKAGRKDVLINRVQMYQPYCISLARDLYLTLPSWIPVPGSVDNWEFTAWDKESHF